MKVISTVGNDLKDIDTLIKYIKAGTDIFRFNFSHINYEKSDLFISFLKSNYPKLSIMADLQGNKIRVSSKLLSEIKVLQGEKIYFCKEEVLFNKSESKPIIPLSFIGNFNIISKNDLLFLNDGNTRLKVDSIENNGNFISTTVIDGGIIEAGKSINIPSINEIISFLSPKDLDDLAWAVKRNVDIITIPYVSKVEHIITIKKILLSYIDEGAQSNIPLVWGKIESLIDDSILDEIIQIADGIVIGRGDLYKEVPLILIPNIQNNIISSCKKAEKPIFMSNNILTSMVNKKTPNMNELAELYYFIKADVNGVILCDEVTKGRYPLQALRFLKAFISYYK